MAATRTLPKHRVQSPAMRFCSSVFREALMVLQRDQDLARSGPLPRSGATSALSTVGLGRVKREEVHDLRNVFKRRAIICRRVTAFERLQALSLPGGLLWRLPPLPHGHACIRWRFRQRKRACSPGFQADQPPMPDGQQGPFCGALFAHTIPPTRTPWRSPASRAAPGAAARRTAACRVRSRRK